MTILNASADTGLSAAFRENGRVVYLETRVGPMKPDTYLQAFPNDPQHEMDARIVDQEGRTFELVVGGDTLIDPSWASDIKSARPIQSAAEGIQRQADFAIARDAAGALALKAAPDLADHVLHLVNMTRAVPQEDARLQETAVRAETQVPVAAERAYGSNGCSSNLQVGQLYYTGLSGLSGALASALSGAQHSSVMAYNYNGCTSSYDQVVVSCNHGPCANSGISYSCSTYSSNGWQYWLDQSLLDYYTMEASGSTGTVSGACTATHYGICEYILFGYVCMDAGRPNHVCNDDSAYELMQISQSTSQTSVGNGGSFNWNGYKCWNNGDVDMYAPSCP